MLSVLYKSLFILLGILLMEGISLTPAPKRNGIRKITGSPQTDSNLFIKKSDLVKLGIVSIKILDRGDDCRREDTSVCFVKYVFDKGRLISEISFDALKADTISAENLAYKYHYKKEVNGKYILSYRDGDAYNSVAQQQAPPVFYKYKNGRLATKEEQAENKKSTGLYPGSYSITHYIYGNNGRIDHLLIDGNGFPYLYYIYDSANRIVGRFPYDIYEQVPSFFNLNAKQEGDFEAGVNNFSEKYLNEKARNFIFEHSYESVKSAALFINGKPVNQFLDRIHAMNKRYLVIEYIDNEFLFIKLLN